jgi:spore coat protein U-like protein
MPAGYKEAAVSGVDAFYTIAAANSLSVYKDGADLVCTGTQILGGDEVSINAALLSYPNVILLPGTFWIDNSIKIPSDRQLWGSGRSSIIRYKDFKNHVGDPNEYGMIENLNRAAGNTNIDIRDILLDIRGGFLGIKDYCILFEKVSNSSIRGCNGEQPVGNYWNFVLLIDSINISMNENQSDRLALLVSMRDSSRCRINNNSCLGFGSNGVLMTGIAGGSNYNVLASNKITDESQGCFIGINIGLGSKNLVSTNLIKSPGGVTGINLQAGSSNNMVHGNLIGRDAGAGGSSITDAGVNNRIRDNVGYDGTWQAES